MKANEFLKILPSLCKNKIVAIHVFLLVGLFIAVVAGSFFLRQSYSAAEANKVQIQSMKATVEKYNEIALKLNAEEYKPVSRAQLDAIQTDLMTNINGLGLVLKGFSKQKSDDSAQAYQVTLQGAWPNIIKMLDNFHSKDALITINKLKIEKIKDTNDVSAEVTYKVYVRE